MTVQPDRAPRRARARATALLVLAATALSGAVAAPAGAGTSGAPAYLRPAHLVPDLGAMDIRLAPFADEGGDTATEDRPLLETTAAYGAVGEYGDIAPGTYAVTVRPQGTPVSEPPLLSLTLDLEAGAAYTVAGLGTKDSPRLELLEDDLTPPGDGNASVRLLAASLTAPTVDVAALGGPVLGEDVALGEPTGYDAAPAGPWTVRASGDGVTGSTDLVLDSGSVYTLLVLDGDDGALSVRPVVDAVGAGTTPAGGAATGFGGLAAPRSPGPREVLLPVAGGLALLGLAGLGAALAVRQRPWARSGARHVHG